MKRILGFIKFVAILIKSVPDRIYKCFQWSQNQPYLSVPFITKVDDDVSVQRAAQAYCSFIEQLFQ